MGKIGKLLDEGGKRLKARQEAPKPRKGKAEKEPTQRRATAPQPKAKSARTGRFATSSVLRNMKAAKGVWANFSRFVGKRKDKFGHFQTEGSGKEFNRGAFLEAVKFGFATKHPDAETRGKWRYHTLDEVVAAEKRGTRDSEEE